MFSDMLSSFSEFHFLRPEWFFALIPLVLILTWLRFEKKSQGDWQHIIPKHLLKHLLHEKQGSSSTAALSLLGIIWLLATFALAGPTWQKVPQPVYEKIQARVYVLDLSYSMYAADLKPNRIVRARLKLMDLLNAKREGLSALVVFSGGAHVVTPLTNDVNTIISLIPALEPKIMPNVGSNAKEGVLKALELLANTRIESGEVILITDEVLLNDRQNINAMMESSPYTLSILGVGTNDGAPIKLPNGEFLKDKSGAIVIPKLNEKELETLASDNKGRFVKLRQDDKDVRYLHKERALDTTNDSRASQQNFDLWLEAGQWLMFPILLLAAFSFRKGWLLALFLCLNFMLAPENIYANETQEKQATAELKPLAIDSQEEKQARPQTQTKPTQSIKNAKSSKEASNTNALVEKWHALWRTGDQRGIASMQAQDFAAAAKQFNNKDWKASAHYYNGQFSQAAELFTADKEANRNRQSDSWYNRGNALARAGDLSGAIKAYEESLALNPENEDAAFNKKLVEDLKNNPPEQNQDKSQDKNQDQNEEQDQKDGEEQKDQKGQQSDKESDKEQNQQGEKNDQQEGEQTDSKQQQDTQEQSDSDNQSEKEQDGEDKEGNEEESEKKSDDSETSDEERTKGEKEEQTQQAEIDNENQEGSEEALSPIEREKQQALEQWLRQVPDDPSGLMRRKFEIENKRRKNTSTDNQQAW